MSMRSKIFVRAAITTLLVLAGIAGLISLRVCEETGSQSEVALAAYRACVAKPRIQFRVPEDDLIVLVDGEDYCFAEADALLSLEGDGRGGYIVTLKSAPSKRDKDICSAGADSIYPKDHPVLRMAVIATCASHLDQPPAR